MADHVRKFGPGRPPPKRPEPEHCPRGSDTYCYLPNCHMPMRPPVGDTTSPEKPWELVEHPVYVSTPTIPEDMPEEPA